MPDCRKRPLNLIGNIDSKAGQFRLEAASSSIATVAKSASASALNDPDLDLLTGTEV